MKQHLTFVGTALIGLASTGLVFAGNQTFNFDIDPGSDPALNGALIVGTHNYANINGFSQLWCSGAGVATNGNPKTGGYLSITDGTNNNNNLVFVFPDVDSGLPIRGFQIDMDLRVGNGSLGRPADGFSVSFARAGDQVLINATNGVAGGFAGGDGSYAVAQSPLGSTDVENGAKSGVAVVFDAWQGNWLPDTPQQSGTGSSDREGMAVRVDDHTLIQINLINNRNWRDCIVGGISQIQSNLTDGGTADVPPAYSGSNPYTGGLSIQTGTNAPITASSGGCPSAYGNTDASGSFTNLFWAHLMVRLTNDPNPRLTVTWKGVTLVNTNLTTFGTAVGRLVLAGRTGGNNENTHADNITVNTTASTNVFLQSIVGTGTGNGFIFTLQDNPPATLASILNVVMDTTNVTPYISTSYAAPITTGVYTQAVRLAQGTFHTVTVTWTDNFNNTNTGSIAFLVPQYVAFPTNFALPLSAVDTTRVGFYVKPYQTRQFNPNQIRWTDEQIMGYRGANIAGAASVPSEAGMLVWDGPIDFDNVNGKAPGPGFFADNYDLLNFGLVSYPQDALHDFYDNIALEMFSYIYFPTQGVYTMVMGSDDGFQLSCSQNPQDRMGQILWNNNGAALPGPAGPGPTDFRNVIVDVPGVYPIRLAWENGGGAAGLEWYTYALPASSPDSGAYLVNDTNFIATASGAPVILTYRALSGSVDVGPYVSKANPVRDAQNVTYYQPIVVELGNGTGLKTVNTAGITLTTDGVGDTISVTTPSAGTTRITQTGTPNWSSGFHTNVLTFSDNAGGNYTYTWRFGALGGFFGLAGIDATNTATFANVPLSAMVSPGTLSQPGLRIHSHQTLFKEPNTVGTVEEEFQGLKGPNVADQSGTNGPGFWSWPGPLDMRGPSGTGTGSAGEWAYDQSFSTFGIQGQVWNNVAGGVPVNFDNCALEIGTWMVFPAAGTYIFHGNSDDGFRVMVPGGGNPFAKAGTDLGWFNGGRGIAGAAGGIQGGGTYVPFRIPAAGAYPIRFVFENGGGDGALEWSVFQAMPDGSIAKVLVNDTNTTGYLQCFQVSSAPTGPSVTYMNPPHLASDVMYFQHHIIKITDGTGSTTSAGQIDGMTMDGQTLTFNASKLGNVTTIDVPPMFGAWAPNQTHTNVLRYHDSASANYTNTYIWRVQNFSPFGIAQVPASYRADPASLSQPGLRIRSYQTVNPNPVPGGNQPNNMNWTEDQFAGLHGPNIADQSGTNGPGFFTWTNVVDFTITKTGGQNSGGAEWNYDYEFTNSAQTHFGFVKNPSTVTDQSQNDQMLEMCTWLNFTQPGDYVMTFNSDDGARLTIPYGNPRSKMAGGIHLTSFEGGRGTAGAGFDPRGGMNWAAFHISTPGAYPFRLLWENGGGGGGVEWSIFQPLADGSLAYTLINDTTTPGTTVSAWQVSSNDTPFVAYIFPPPADVYGPQPTIFLTPGLSTPTQVPTTQTNDLTIVLSDATTSVNTNTISLTFNGISQPISISGSNGLTYITRSATAVPYWPPGAYGQLILTFTDSSGRTINDPVTYVSTAFWGTLANQNGYPLGSGDSSRRGFLLRTYALDPSGSTAIPQRNHVTEQILTGLWGPNTANPVSPVYGNANNFLPPPTNGYFILAGSGSGGSNGLVNFNPGGGSQGDFTSANGYTDQVLPGIPGTVGTAANRTNDYVCEFLSYLEFPTNGTYLLCVSSDDGFRLTRGWGAANNNGALVVNLPASLRGPKPTAQSSLLLNVGSGTTPVTNPITGTLVLARGPYSGGTPNNPYGSTNFNGLGYSVDGCVINNAGALAGNIALMYRSTSCGIGQQMDQAVAAGARAVVFVQNRPASEGPFPTEPNATPLKAIPAVMIEYNDAQPLIAAMATNNPVVTITPMDYLVNPPPANSPLGQADFGKGASDVIFPLVVPTAGVFPVRLIYVQGGGGANVEFWSVVGTNRVLINDDFNTNGVGPGIKAYYGLNSGVHPTLGFAFDGVNFATTNSGTLETNGVIPITPGTWVDIYNNAPQTVPVIPNGPSRFFQAR